MANIFKFQATNKVNGTLGLGFSNPAPGDTFYLTDSQLRSTMIRNYIELGYIEPLAEDSSAISEAMMEYWDGTVKYVKNTMPASCIEIVPPITANTLVNAIGADLSAGFKLDRKVAFTGVKARFSVAPLTAATHSPRLLITAGDCTPVTPSLLTTYDNSLGVYTAATNGGIAHNAPITWAADDLLIIGYTEKFASAMFNMTTHSTGSTTAIPYYWNGTEWVMFPTYNDFTGDSVAGTSTLTLSRVGDTDNSRMVWWEKPDSWLAGGPAGSGVSSSTYCVAIKFSGVLTNLAGASVYPVLDTPIASMDLGTQSSDFAPAAVIKKLGTTYTDETNVTVAWAMNGFTTTDYIWVGFNTPQTGFAVNVTGVNANAQTAVLTYWNGISWVACPTVTDGTESFGATWAQDGTITIANIPKDWVPLAATNTNVTGTSTPATVTTDELYWLRYTVTGVLDANGTGVIVSGVPGLNIWHEFEPKHLTFVDEGEQIHTFVLDENATIAALNIEAMVADI